MDALIEGEAFHVKYPFIKGWFEPLESDGDGVGKNVLKGWRPGIDATPDEGGTLFAHGEGHMVLTVVSTHKPGKYPERVFYVRQWTDPDGKTFGKRGLRMTTVYAFRNLLNGYRYSYELQETEEEAA